MMSVWRISSMPSVYSGYSRSAGDLPMKLTQNIATTYTAMLSSSPTQNAVLMASMTPVMKRMSYLS